MEDQNIFATEEEKEAFVYNIVEKETDNFFGGTPYLAEGEEYPRDENGEPWVPFIQINLREIPELEEFIKLPKTGVLQIFTHNDVLYGASFDDYDDPSVGAKTLIRHIENPVKNTYRIEDIFPKDKTVYTPLEDFPKRINLEGHKTLMTPLYGSLESGTAVTQDWEEREAENHYGYAGYPFYIGGYPAFTQTDFREDLETFTFIAGSDSVDQVLWGDVGIGNFWIPSEHQNNYSKAFLTYDCF